MTKLLGVFLTALLLVPTEASASTSAVDCPQEARSPSGVKALIQCAAPKMGVSTTKALAIAYRESHYQPGAKNPRSSAAGVFQVVSGTWRYFVGHFRWGHRVGTSVYDGRANVILSLRYVRARGWGPWS
jgi:soluble lytic murein transglycosylase-like protein